MTPTADTHNFSLGGGPLVDTTSDHVLDLYKTSPTCRDAHSTKKEDTASYNLGGECSL